MCNAVRLRDDFTALEVRALARRSKDSAQVRRLLSTGAIYDGMDRNAAARIGSMDICSVPSARRAVSVPRW